jgi:small-conductance mechanosensitive channel/CRP-like cAMP-binding protein
VTWSWSLALYLGFLIVLIGVSAGFQVVTRNSHIRRKLRISVLLLTAALIYDVAFTYIRGGQEPSRVGLILLALGVINAAAALIFNPFREERISDRYPRIVQDAAVVGAFVMAATYIAPDRLFATSAIGGLVLGLALQDTLGNLFAGLAIQVEKPFRVGDWITAAKYEGRVMEVTWRATKIKNNAGNFIIIPNSLLSKETLVNYSQPSPIQRVEHKIGLSYSAAPNMVKKVITQTYSAIPEILQEPQPDVLLREYADFSINYGCRFWITDFARKDLILDKFTTLLYYRLRRAGIEVPFPIRDVRIAEPDDKRSTLPADSRCDFLEKVELFTSLSEEHKQAIAAAMEPVTFAAGERIIRQSEAGDSMFVIRSGEVRIVFENSGQSTELALLHEGDYFGEMALLTGEPRTASAVAASDVDTLMLCKEPFRFVLLQDPQIGEKISHAMVRRKEEIQQQLDEMKNRVSVELPVETQQKFLARIQKFFGLS